MERLVAGLTGCGDLERIMRVERSRISPAARHIVVRTEYCLHTVLCSKLIGSLFALTAIAAIAAVVGNVVDCPVGVHRCPEVSTDRERAEYERAVTHDNVIGQHR